MKLRTVVIDDDPACVGQLVSALTRLDVEVSGSATSATEGLRQIQKHTPDVVFLDVEMPEKNGLELLDELGPRTFEVIIVSAHENFALDAYRHHAFHYLLKPYSDAELQETLARVAQRRTPDAHATAAGDQPEPHRPSKRIAVSLLNGTHILDVADIVYCEGDGNYTTLFLKKGEKLTASQPVKAFEAQLSDRGFVRVHKRHLINLQAVEFIDHNGGIQLRDVPVRIQVAQRRRKDLMQRLLSS